MSEALEGAISSELTNKRIQKRTRANPSSPVDTISAETTSEDGSLKSSDKKQKPPMNKPKFQKKTKFQKGKTISISKSPRALPRTPLRKSSPDSKQDSAEEETSDDTIVETDVTIEEILEDQEGTESIDQFSSNQINHGWESAAETESATGIIYQEDPVRFSLDEALTILIFIINFKA